MNIVALIPARGGSKRCPGKNTRILAGHPLLAYTIAAARASEVFSHVYVSSDDPETLRIASRYGAMACARREDFARDDSPDIEWVRDLLQRLLPMPDVFAILRPTSPFRNAFTIRRAFVQFQALPPHVDSLRAVQPVREHPGKMWRIESDTFMKPLLDHRWEAPWHSKPTQTLPAHYVQNGSLEIAHARVIRETDTISGLFIAPFLTAGVEGFDLNTEDDWRMAQMMTAHLATLMDVPA